MLYICMILLASYTVEARYTSEALNIDGFIEEAWYAADTVKHFVQSFPYPDSFATESTYVFILYDDANLYIACMCFSEGTPIEASLSKTEDYITVYIDPFLSRTNAYKFGVYASGMKDDAMLLDDGKRIDYTWDGVWYAKTKVYPTMWVAEVRIPFKAIRYKRGLTEWGLNINRYIVNKNERIWWVPIDPKIGVRVSEFGILENIKPKVKGWQLELYPIGVMRTDSYEDTSYIKPIVGLNMNWRLSPQVSLSLTYKPDFAEIESDPFSLNLSRFETYFRERRPFFLEGKDIFDEPHRSIRAFYSRRIGRRLYGGVDVPIMFGGKLICKESAWNLGLLYAFTERVVSQYDEEPQTHWCVIRYIHKLGSTSDIAYCGAIKKPTAIDVRFNYGSSLIYTLRRRYTYFRSELYHAYHKYVDSTVSDVAFMASMDMNLPNWYLRVYFRYVGEDFDLSPTGRSAVVPGSFNGEFTIGPSKIYRTGKIFRLQVLDGIIIYKDPGLPYSIGNTVMLNLSFRPYGRLAAYTFMGKNYYTVYVDGEFRDTSYWSWDAAIVYTSRVGPQLSYGVSASYVHSWVWGFQSIADYIALSTSFVYGVSDFLSISVAPYCKVYWVDHRLHMIYAYLRPSFNLNFTPTLSLSVIFELAPIYEEGSYSIPSINAGYFLSWEIAPKSWLYVVTNELYERTEKGRFNPLSHVSAIKLKWLYLF